MTSQFPDIMLSSNFFEVALFLLSDLVTGPSFMSISWLILELWQFSFIANCPEIQNSELPPSKVWSKSGDWGLGRVRDTKFAKNVSNKMLLNAGKCHGYSFYNFGVIKRKPSGLGGGGGGGRITFPRYTRRLGLNSFVLSSVFTWWTFFGQSFALRYYYLKYSI